MVGPFRVAAVLAAALGVLLAAVAADAHPRVAAVEPLAIAPDPLRVESARPDARADEARLTAAGPPDVESDPGSWVADSPPASPIPILLVALLAAVSTAAGCRRPRAVALTLSLALAGFTIQTAVHSVHHLGRPHEAEQCPVFSASQHAPGDLPSAPAVDRPAEAPTELVSVVPALLASDSAERPDRGRAPPAPLA
jgi:hypothetical protein